MKHMKVMKVMKDHFECFMVFMSFMVPRAGSFDARGRIPPYCCVRVSAKRLRSRAGRLVAISIQNPTRQMIR